MKASLKKYQELMSYRVQRILVVASPYDAFIMDEDGGVMDHVFTSFRGISLASPPKFTVTNDAEEALKAFDKHHYDLVITMPRLIGMDAMELGKKIKSKDPNTIVVLLAHNIRALNRYALTIPKDSIDKVFIWSGNKNILWAIVKWLEDKMNVAQDIQNAMVRVIIFIEDSPIYYSSILPTLYEAVVQQAQAALDDSLNAEHQLLRLRGRPKILLAENYEEGMELYRTFRPFILGIFSDIRYPMNGKVNPEAGIIFLKNLKGQRHDLPILLLSSERANKAKAHAISAHFLDKNSHSLHLEIRKFLVDNLGFGDFVFKMPDGSEVARATNLSSLERQLHVIPDESLAFHIKHNHFSSWLMAHSEIILASKFRAEKYNIYQDINEIRKFLIESIHEYRVSQQRGVVVEFNSDVFDAEAEYQKIGDGSLGGKARGLAFMAQFIQQNLDGLKEFENVDINIPQTLVITTECFDQFLNKNHLQDFSELDCEDEEVASAFLAGDLPLDLEKKLKIYLTHIHYPLAVRSSSLLEDSHFQPYAGLYKTYMLPNNHQDIEVRLQQLSEAVRLIYASIFYKGPKAYNKTTLHRTEEEKMAIVIQEVAGQRYGDFYYPTLSGTAQSHNFYPLSYMKAEEGIAHMALGLGKTVVEGGQALRFSPEYPQLLPQFSKVEDILKNAQKDFFALKLDDSVLELSVNEDTTLKKRSIHDAFDETPVKILSSTYNPANHIIRDSFDPTSGSPIITFANILKYDLLPLPQILSSLLKLSKEGLGYDLEMEFAVNVNPGGKHQFQFLQVRPMVTDHEDLEIEILKTDIEKAFCHSTSALGSSIYDDVMDIVFVHPENFSSLKTVEIAREISRINASFEKQNKKYILIGPGRWGSADKMLGIPVKWHDISAVIGIVEASIKNFRVDPSQGTHFFQNITSLGVFYLTIYRENDFVDWSWLQKQKALFKSDYISHIKLDKSVSVKIDGKKNNGVLII